MQNLRTRQLPCLQRLALQLRRSSLSIPGNIAEGDAYGAEKIFLRHVRIAMGSLAEVETQIELAKRLDLLGPATDANLGRS